jgi:hypothetical protein
LAQGQGPVGIAEKQWRIKMVYKGVIIEESLCDKSVLDIINIDKF